MAHVVPSKLAPDETVTYGLANVDFELGPGDSYETDDRTVLANATAHPWLEVEYDETEKPVARFRPGSIDPKDDVLSAENSIAFDPEEVEAAAAEHEEEVAEPVAIESGLKQEKKVEKGGIAFTHAADETRNEEETD